MADISITAGNVVPAAAVSGVYAAPTYARGIAGASITAGQVVYIDTSDSDKIKLADANGSSATATVAGVAMHAAGTGQSVTYCTSGGVTIGGTIAAGQTYVVSSNAGGLAPHADLTTGWYSSVVGWGYSTTVLVVAIQNRGVAIA